MAFGIIKADTLTHSTAGSVTTNNVVEGSAKAWVEFNGTGTVAINDSFNIASIVDDATGKYDLTFTNSMNNANFASTGAAGERDDGGGNRSFGLRAKSTSGQNCRGFRDGVSADDLQEMCFHTMGDLA
tara:strand:+ start:744 stop:1127 length:384 start_codon:yes stop_codon:yes gene_type:complete